MITLRRAVDRTLVRHDNTQIWLTFSSEEVSGPLAGGFGALESLNEILLPPGAAAASYPRQSADVITYVLKGALAQTDPQGRAFVLRTGEFQHTAAGRASEEERNASEVEWAQVFRMVLRPTSIPNEDTQQQRLFTASERRGRLWVVASPDGRKKTLRIDQDVLVYSALLQNGRHIVHETPPGQMVWLHIVRGEVRFEDLILVTGDGVGIQDELNVSCTSIGETELLLIALNGRPHRVSNAPHWNETSGSRRSQTL